jgi:hypothetical protein
LLNNRRTISVWRISMKFGTNVVPQKIFEIDIY